MRRRGGRPLLVLRGWLPAGPLRSRPASARLRLLASVLLGLQARPLLRLLALALLGLQARPLLRLLALALEPRRLLLGAEGAVRLGHRLADRPGDDRARADRVVVARDHIVDPIRVAVGVDQADDRNSQPLRLG